MTCYDIIAKYITSMRRTNVSRIAAMSIAVLTVISVPGSGLAHGYAHHEAIGHEVHQHPSGAEPDTESRDGMNLLSEAADTSETHVHPQLAFAVSGRMHAPLLVDAGIPETIATGIEPARTASVPFSHAPLRASSPPDAAPKQSRAPPTG